ncbi:MAG: TonB-dependent receptor [Marinicella sp.]
MLSKSLDSQAEGFSGDISIGYSSANEGKTTALNTRYKTDNHAIFLGLDSERGNNQSTPLGKNIFTGLERDFYSASYQYDNGQQRLVLSSNYNDTGETGTPALPMDITYAQGGISQLDFTTSLNEQWKLNAALSYQYTKHLMDNYLHRIQLPVNQRASLTRVNKNGFSLQASKTSDDGGVSFGLAFDDVDNTADISNPNNAQFHITNFDVNKQRISFFTEYQKQLSDKHQYMLGVRYTDTDANAGTVQSSVAMMDNSMGLLHRTLRDRFNAANRSRSDQNLDVMFNWQHTLNKNLSLEYGIAVKNRTPTHQERYLWLPLEATAGLADGRQYLGNLDLESEQAIQWELGMNFQQGAFTSSPHLFYHRINDYIQGVPNTVMPAPAGVLRYANVEAELYGFDVESSYQFNEQFSMRHVITYVRGKRRDIDDNLYRIAPLNTWINLSYTQQQWQFEADIMAAVRQDKVSMTNTEKETPGYGVLNLSVIKSFKSDSYVKLAVNNVFDKLYYQHTNGYNRNNNNIDVGFNPSDLQAFRLPSEGRSLQVSYFYGW